MDTFHSDKCTGYAQPSGTYVSRDSTGRYPVEDFCRLRSNKDTFLLHYRNEHCYDLKLFSQTSRL